MIDPEYNKFGRIDKFIGNNNNKSNNIKKILDSKSNKDNNQSVSIINKTERFECPNSNSKYNNSLDQDINLNLIEKKTDSFRDSLPNSLINNINNNTNDVNNIEISNLNSENIILQKPVKHLKNKMDYKLANSILSNIDLFNLGLNHNNLSSLNSGGQPNINTNEYSKINEIIHDNKKFLRKRKSYSNSNNADDMLLANEDIINSNQNKDFKSQSKTNKSTKIRIPLMPNYKIREENNSVFNSSESNTDKHEKQSNLNLNCNSLSNIDLNNNFKLNSHLRIKKTKKAKLSKQKLGLIRKRLDFSGNNNLSQSQSVNCDTYTFEGNACLNSMSSVGSYSYYTANIKTNYSTNMYSSLSKPTENSLSNTKLESPESDQYNFTINNGYLNSNLKSIKTTFNFHEKNNILIENLRKNFNSLKFKNSNHSESENVPLQFKSENLLNNTCNNDFHFNFNNQNFNFENLNNNFNLNLNKKFSNIPEGIENKCDKLENSESKNKDTKDIFDFLKKTISMKTLISNNKKSYIDSCLETDIKNYNHLNDSRNSEIAKTFPSKFPQYNHKNINPNLPFDFYNDNHYNKNTKEICNKTNSGDISNNIQMANNHYYNHNNIVNSGIINQSQPINLNKEDSLFSKDKINFDIVEARKKNINSNPSNFTNFNNITNFPLYNNSISKNEKPQLLLFCKNDFLSTLKKEEDIISKHEMQNNKYNQSQIIESFPKDINYGKNYYNKDIRNDIYNYNNDVLVSNSNLLKSMLNKTSFFMDNVKYLETDKNKSGDIANTLNENIGTNVFSPLDVKKLNRKTNNKINIYIVDMSQSFYPKYLLKVIDCDTYRNSKFGNQTNIVSNFSESKENLNFHSNNLYNNDKEKKQINKKCMDQLNLMSSITTTKEKDIRTNTKYTDLPIDIKNITFEALNKSEKSVHNEMNSNDNSPLPFFKNKNLKTFMNSLENSPSIKLHSTKGYEENNDT